MNSSTFVRSGRRWWFVSFVKRSIVAFATTATLLFSVESRGVASTPSAQVQDMEVFLRKGTIREDGRGFFGDLYELWGAGEFVLSVKVAEQGRPSSARTSFWQLRAKDGSIFDFDSLLYKASDVDPNAIIVVTFEVQRVRQDSSGLWTRLRSAAGFVALATTGSVALGLAATVADRILGESKGGLEPVAKGEMTYSARRDGDCQRIPLRIRTIERAVGVGDQAKASSVFGARFLTQWVVMCAELEADSDDEDEDEET